MNGTPLDILYSYYRAHPLSQFRMTYEQFAYYYTKWVNEYNCKIY